MASVPEFTGLLRMGLKILRFIGRRWVWFLLLALLCSGYYWVMIRTGLPSDEEMIAHFKAHRADIEELVQRYRRFEALPTEPHSTWAKQGDTPALLARAGINRITNIASVWLPNPYSVETAIETDRRIQDEASRRKTSRVIHHYGTLQMELVPYQKYSAANLFYVAVWKDFVFIPEIPRIEDGQMLGPSRKDGDYSFRKPVVSSLDHLPLRWRDFGCVYRQIEPQWFLRMCNGH